MDSPLSSVSFEVENDVILSTENEVPIPTPTPAIAIPIPPATADDIVRQVLERDSLSPRSAYNALEAHGEELSSEVALSRVPVLHNEGDRRRRERRTPQMDAWYALT